MADPVGGNVLLSCSSNLPFNISWHLYYPNGSRHCFFNGLKLSSKECPNCHLNHTLPGQWDIWFTADIAHAKVFECTEPWTTESGKASVTVLGRSVSVLRLFLYYFHGLFLCSQLQPFLNPSFLLYFLHVFLSSSSSLLSVVISFIVLSIFLNSINIPFSSLLPFFLLHCLTYPQIH